MRSRHFPAVTLSPRLIKMVVLAVAFVAVLALFRGWFRQGMEMDEVSRVINLIPLFRSDAEPLNPVFYSLHVGDTTIPVMFKEYVSSAYMIRFLPILLFPDYVTGIRLLYLFYFLFSLTLFFLIFQRLDLYLASIAVLLIATTPLYYPEVRIGFADTLQIAAVAAAFFFWKRFRHDHQKRGSLFMVFLILFGTANQMFYFSWVIAALFVSSVILLPDELRPIFSSFRNIALIAVACALGLINFLIFNLARGFPTLTILLTSLFNRDQYNQTPIDYSKSAPFLEDLQIKLSGLSHFMGVGSSIFLVFHFSLALVFLGCTLWAIRSGTMRQFRYFLFPYVVAVCVLVLILLSPKTTRPGHYVFLIPFTQLAIASAFLWISSHFPNRLARNIVRALPVGLILFSFFASNREIGATNRTGGTGLFSPAVFDFVDYLEVAGIKPREVVFLTWGLYAQPYFIREGRFKIQHIVYHLIDKQTPAEKHSVLRSFLCSSVLPPGPRNRLYFPLFATFRPDINEALSSFVEARGGRLSLEATFSERDGSPAILLYRLDDADAFCDEMHDRLRRIPVSTDLEVENYGPRRVEPGRSQEFNMWFIARGLSPSVRVSLNGMLLRTVYASDHVTAALPPSALQQAGRLQLQLVDLQRNIASRPVSLEVVKESPSS